MFYIEKDNEIIMFDTDKTKIENTLLFTPQYSELEIKETDEGYAIVDFKLVTVEEAKTIANQKERERLNLLSLTAADVERAIYKVKGLDFDDILELVKDNPNIDSKALKIELKANNFYRGNPYVSSIGNILGFTEEQLDKFFEAGDYEELM